MFRRITYIATMFLSINALAQKVKVDDFNKDFEKYRLSNHFDFVHDDFDSSRLTWVADLTATFDTVVPGMLGEAYAILKEKSNKLGGNAFKVKSSNIFDYGEKYITISSYWLRMEDRDANDTLFRSSTVYLFGLLGYHQEIDGYDVSIEDEDFVMHALTYRKREYNDGQEVSLQLGSKVRGYETHISVSDKTEGNYYYFHMLRGSFKNAVIKEYPRDYAMFLTRILQYE